MTTPLFGLWGAEETESRLLLAWQMGGAINLWVQCPGVHCGDHEGECGQCPVAGKHGQRHEREPQGEEGEYLCPVGAVFGSGVLDGFADIAAVGVVEGGE